MERHEILDKLEDIQTANYNRFVGTNESELHTREEIADFIEELLLEASAGKNNIDSSELHLPLGDVSGAVCKHEKVIDVRWCYKCTNCDKLLEAAN